MNRSTFNPEPQEYLTEGFLDPLDELEGASDVINIVSENDITTDPEVEDYVSGLFEVHFMQDIPF